MESRKLFAGLIVLATLIPPPAHAARPRGGEFDAPEPAPPQPTRPSLPVDPEPSEPAAPVPAGTPSFDSGVPGVDALQGLPAPFPAPQHCPGPVFVPKPVAGPSSWAVPADYDGDGAFDPAVVHRGGTWKVDFSRNGFGVYDLEIAWAEPQGEYVPLPGDYDGDCSADLGAKDSAGNWYIDYHANEFGSWDLVLPGYGGAEATPVPADYDGDGKVDLAIKTTAGLWRIDFAYPSFGTFDVTYSGFGGADYVPVPADYDRDLKADFSTKNGDGTWFVDRSSNGRGEVLWDEMYGGFGGPEYEPVPADYDGDGYADFSTRDAWDRWLIDYAKDEDGVGAWDRVLGGFAARDAYRPVPGDYDGDRAIDVASQTDDGFWLLDFAIDGLGDWNQVFNAYVTVSARGEVTTEELSDFDAKWNANPAGEAALRCSDGSVWIIDGRLDALARMHELTRDSRYAYAMSLFVRCLIDSRDDHSRNADGVLRQPYDALRRLAGLPAWGSANPGNAGRYAVDVTISSLYAHGLALFARLVFEDGELRRQYGALAIEAANTALETAEFFRGELRTQVAGSFVEAFHVHHPNLANTWSEEECETDVCRNKIEFAGLPIAHNENLLFARMLIETTRALDSAYYRQSPLASTNAAQARSVYPLTVSRLQRYFVNRLRPVSSWFGTAYRWYHNDDLPDGVHWWHGSPHLAHTHWDDIAHGGAAVKALRVLTRDLSRLNVVAQSWGEPIPWGSEDIRNVANTFLLGVLRGANLARNVNGEEVLSDDPDSENGGCGDWIELAAVQPAIYDICREMLLRVVDGDQPYLSMRGHAALLALKRELYGTAPPPPQPGTTTTAPLSVR